MSKKPSHERLLIANNKKARFDYFIEDTLECGIVLQGTEVKALRLARGASLQECYAGENDGELWLYNLYIPDYGHAGSHLQHNHKRPRKLLAHKREVQRLFGAISKEGITLVPLQLYFNKRGLVKLELGIAKGKKQHDKRQTMKDRDWNRKKARVMTEYN
tara:strand:- start:102 stop:581 length:480 start_codon:yes stop_codon:yes gene_type:complete